MWSWFWRKKILTKTRFKMSLNIILRSTINIITKKSIPISPFLQNGQNKFYHILSRTISPLPMLTPTIPAIVQNCGFKVKGHLKRRCKDCYFVTREQRQYVICPTHPRHKQMAMKKKEKNTWILTHATQGKYREW